VSAASVKIKKPNLYNFWGPSYVIMVIMFILNIENLDNFTLQGKTTLSLQAHFSKFPAQAAIMLLVSSQFASNLTISILSLSWALTKSKCGAHYE
jgi:hypothetical protein